MNALQRYVAEMKMVRFAPTLPSLAAVGAATAAAVAAAALALVALSVAAALGAAADVVVVVAAGADAAGALVSAADPPDAITYERMSRRGDQNPNRRLAVANRKYALDKRWQSSTKKIRNLWCSSTQERRVKREDYY